MPLNNRNPRKRGLYHLAGPRSSKPWSTPDSVDGTWPLRTESAGRLIGRGANAIVSSIVHVCRKLKTNALIATRAEFLRALRREMPERVDKIRRADFGAVDMEQSIIGPGMGILLRPGVGG